MNASEIMTEDPMTADARTTLRQAVQILQSLQIRHLPVVGEGGALIGMLSDRDLRDASVSLESPGDAKVTTVMSADVISIDPETEAGEIIDLMLENRVGALPVVDPGSNELLGIVSYVDVLRAVRSLV